MRGDAARFELVPARSLAELLGVLAASNGEHRPLAGGTDVMVLFAAGKLAHTRYVNAWGIPELQGIREEGDALVVGAGVTYTEVQAHPVVRRDFPMLCQAASETGGVAIQNRGTLGGNIANASPAADSPPALLAYGAELELASARGVRKVSYDAFHTGYKTTVLAPDEVVLRIFLPRPRAPRVDVYRKVGPRRAQAISKVCFAGSAEVTEGKVVSARIALGGVAPIIPRCPKTEAVVRELPEEPGARAGWRAAARGALAAEIAPIDDIRSTAKYRRRVAENLLADFLRCVEQRASRVGLGS